MEWEQMQKLAALEQRIDTARVKLAWDIKIGLMDTGQAIKEIELRLGGVQNQAQAREKRSVKHLLV